MAETKEVIVLFLEKTRLSIFDGDKIVRVSFPTNTIRDLDVIDRSGLDSLLDDFIKNGKLTPVNILFVLADTVCFSKEITVTDLVTISTETKDFLEVVPFDQIISKSYRSQNGIRVIATNEELIDAIKEIFERDGFTVEALAPSVIFPIFTTKRSFDDEIAKNIIASRNVMRQGNMLSKIVITQSAVAPMPQPRVKSKKLPYLIGAFVVLISILFWVLTHR